MNIQTSDFDELAARLRGAFAHTPPDLSDQDFNALAREIFALQFEHNEVYQRFCRRQDRTPDRVHSWKDIPAVPTAAFREFDFTCLPEAQREFVFNSSGTTGPRPSRHFHSAASLALYESSLQPWFREHLLPDDPSRTPMVLLCPAPGDAPHSSLAHMLGTVQYRWGGPKSLWSGTCDAAGNWRIDAAAAAVFFEDVIPADEPVLVLGTAFSLVHLLDALAAQDRRFQLPGGSRVMETGGYKGRSRVLRKEELHQLITDRLGVPPEWIVCEYGMSELSSQAYNGIAGRISESGAFRFPPWARTRIISPENGRDVGLGETGLLHIHDLANLWSVAAIQTEDLARQGEEGVTLLGRAQLAEPRGCSLMSP